MVLMLEEKKILQIVKWEGKNVLLFGSEGFGMREHTGKYADFFVKIDMNKEYRKFKYIK